MVSGGPDEMVDESESLMEVEVSFSNPPNLCYLADILEAVCEESKTYRLLSVSTAAMTFVSNH